MTGTKFGGERVDLAHFKEGWLLFGFGKGHYFRRDDGEFRPLCGAPSPCMLRDRAGFVAFRPGDFGNCQRCQGKLSSTRPATA